MEPQVSSRKLKLERSVKELEALANIVLYSNDAIFSTDSEGIIISWNRGAEDLLGYSSEEIIGKALQIVIPEDRLPESLDIRRAVVEEGINSNIETVRLHKSGRRINVSLSSFPLKEDNGQIKGVSGIIRDITEKKEQEIKVVNALLEGQENERKRISQELHDGLGQLFAGLKMNLDALKPFISERQIYKRITDIAQEVLDEYRAVSHDLMPPALKEDGLQNAILLVVKRLNKVSDIEVVCKIDELKDRLPLSLEIELFRIFQELLNNAIKYSRATRIVIKLESKNQELKLSVQDDGIGFKVKSMDSMKEGIGLKNILTRASLIGGEFDIKSSPGKGTNASVAVTIWEN